MMTFSQAKLEIVRCDNGYVVEWHEVPEANNFSYSINRPTKATNGVKIFTTKKQVLTFLSSFFPGPA